MFILSFVEALKTEMNNYQDNKPKAQGKYKSKFTIVE